MEFLTFRKMVTPIFIQLLFWLGVIGVIGAGIVTMTAGDEPVLGILMIILGPLVVRIYAELMIVLFRIHSSLNELVKISTDNAAGQPTAGASTWQQSQAAQPAPGYGQQSSQQGYAQQQGGYTQQTPPSSNPPSSNPPQGPPPSGPPSP